MKNIVEELLERATDESSAGEGTVPELDLVSGDDAQPDLAPLMEFLGTHRDVGELCLRVDGEPAGVITRTAFHSFVRARTKGIGDGGRAELPGTPRARLFELRCPVEGCPTWKLTVSFEPGAALYCPRHPDTQLEARPCS